MTLEIKGYKCFQDNYNGFKEIKGINLLIGKNNSGKSSLINLLELVVGKDAKQIKPLGNSKIRLTGVLEKTWFESVFSKSREIKMHGNNVGLNDIKKFTGSPFEQIISSDGKSTFNFLFEHPSYYKPDFNKSVLHFKNPFSSFKFRKIASERNFRAEQENVNVKLESDGKGASNYIQRFQNYSDLDRSIVTELLLNELNKIINPEIKFSELISRRNKDDRNLWEVYFENEMEYPIPVSAMGSGLQTILTVLVNLLLVPRFEKTKPDKYIFAFEELENNLHPSLQKRLIKYIIDYQKEHNSTFFLTTHSNAFIDILSTTKNAQIIHVTNDTKISKATVVQTQFDKYSIIEDLGNKASDLLQSNGIIWVEGPSDRTYLNKWISLLDESLIEGMHYSIMHYGGRLLAGVTLLTEYLEQQLIPLLKINRNAFVMIDSDSKSDLDKITKTKIRIESEIGEELCWITEGKEIENYLSKKVINKWLKEKGKEIKSEPAPYENVGDLIKKEGGIDYNSNKAKFSREISEFINTDDLSIMDLKEQIENLVENIRDWNK